MAVLRCRQDGENRAVRAILTGSVQERVCYGRWNPMTFCSFDPQDGENRTVRAVLTGALQESDGTTYNVATQMNSFVYNTVVGWCAAASTLVRTR